MGYVSVNRRHVLSEDQLFATYEHEIPDFLKHRNSKPILISIEQIEKLGSLEKEFADLIENSSDVDFVMAVLSKYSDVFLSICGISDKPTIASKNYSEVVSNR